MKQKIKSFDVWPELDLLGKAQWYCTGLTPLAIFGPYHNEQEARNECAARMKSWLGQQRENANADG